MRCVYPVVNITVETDDIYVYRRIDFGRGIIYNSTFFLQNSNSKGNGIGTEKVPFRGYYQYTLYGNHYTQANVDVYFPIFQTLVPVETALSVINNI